ncbi:hypothetical protein EG333_16895 [Pectobacterium versatile]|nr:hypothetical protein EG333_16895 [Pectobacterium versatile]
MYFNDNIFFKLSVFSLLDFSLKALFDIKSSTASENPLSNGVIKFSRLSRLFFPVLMENKSWPIKETAIFFVTEVALKPNALISSMSNMFIS